MPPALRFRDFRIYFAGQLVSVVGTWMQAVALTWLVAQQTDSGLLLGIVVAAEFLPTLLLAPVAGLVADRYPRRTVLIVTQCLSVLPAAAMFVFTWSGEPPYWVAAMAALALGVVRAFDVPARQAMALEMVGREHLASAKALSSTAFNLAAVLGPPFAGLLIAQVGLSLCFLADAVSYLAAVLSLVLIRGARTPAVTAGQREPALAALQAGLAYARRDVVVQASLLGLVAYSLLAMQPAVLLPFFADDVLHLGAFGYGMLVAAEGGGAVLGTMVLSALPSSRVCRGEVVLAAVAVSIGALLGVSASRTPALSVALLVVAGFAMVWVLLISATRIQAETPDALQGRVMALYAQASPNGSGPLGSVVIGALASGLGAPAAMALASRLAGAAFLALRFRLPDAFRTPPAPALVTVASGNQDRRGTP